MPRAVRPPTPVTRSRSSMPPAPTASTRAPTAPARLDSRAAALAAGSAGAADVAAFDVGLSAGLLRYLRQLHKGRVDPRGLGLRLTTPRDEHDYAAIVREALAGHRLNAAAAGLAPPLAQYPQPSPHARALPGARLRSHADPAGRVTHGPSGPAVSRSAVASTSARRGRRSAFGLAACGRDLRRRDCGRRQAIPGPARPRAGRCPGPGHAGGAPRAARVARAPDRDGARTAPLAAGSWNRAPDRSQRADVSPVGVERHSARRRADLRHERHCRARARFRDARLRGGDADDRLSSVLERAGLHPASGDSAGARPRPRLPPQAGHGDRGRPRRRRPGAGLDGRAHRRARGGARPRAAAPRAEERARPREVRLSQRRRRVHARYTGRRALQARAPRLQSRLHPRRASDRAGGMGARRPGGVAARADYCRDERERDPYRDAGAARPGDPLLHHGSRDARGRHGSFRRRHLRRDAALDRALARAAQARWPARYQVRTRPVSTWTKSEAG